MVLEATMIVVDNSENSRNGDYLPTRFGAQCEAANIIFNAKTGANPESSVGLMSMGGKGPETLVTLTTDFGKVLEGLHRTQIRGTAHLSTGIQVASLALKHRSNHSQRQRIIVFNCSPITEDEKSLIKLAKKLKKSNVSVDFVAFGDLESDTKTKLEAFNEQVNGGEGSNLLFVPPGPNMLSDVLITSPILAGQASAGGAAGGSADLGLGGDVASTGPGTGFEFGVDPTVDPELAMALRMSMEEETSRLAREQTHRDDTDRKDETRLEGIPEEGAAGGESSSAGAKAEEKGSEKKDGKDEKKDGDGGGAAGDKMDTS